MADPDDAIASLVIGRLREGGHAFHILNPDTEPERPWFHAEWRSGALRGGWFAGPGWEVDFGALSGVFVRLGTSPASPPPPGPDGARRTAASMERVGLLCMVIDALPCTVVNRLLAGMSNMSKPHQSLLIQACGLAVPETLVTNDPAAARAFIALHDGSVIAKSLSGVRSIVKRIGPSHMARLPLLRHGPAQFQALVPGTDVRVHVVGERVFATRIESAAVDYRFAPRDGVAVAMTETTLPDDIAAACVRVARRLNLELAGIDLMRTPAGEYVCFEANPAPAFIAFEAVTGQPIGAAIAALLAEGRPHCAFTST